jgi:hypothetical protein
LPALDSLTTGKKFFGAVNANTLGGLSDFLRPLFRG